MTPAFRTLVFAVLVVLVGAGAAWGAPLDDARRLLAQGKAAEAHRMVAAFLEAHPQDREGRFLLANILAQEGRLDAAYGLFQELVTQAPGDAVGSAVARIFRERGATAQDAVRIGALFGKAQQAAKAGDLDTAIAALAEVTHLAPDNLAARNNVAQLLEQAGRAEEAIPHLEALAKLRPRDLGVLRRLALAYDRAGKVDAAATAYEKLLRARPRDVEILYALGRLELFSKDAYARSAELFRAVLALDPKRVEAQFLLGVSLNSSGDSAGAMEAFRTTVALDATFFRAHFELAQLYEAAGRDAEALKEFQATARYGGDSPEAEQSRRRIALFGTSADVAAQVRTALDAGLKALEQGDLEAAKTAFNRVLSLVPGNTLALYNLATVYTREGKNDAAIDALKKAIASDETHFLSYYGLALIYAGSGRFEEAFDAYKQVLKWAPPDSPYYAEAKQKVEAVEKILAAYASKKDAREAFVQGNKLAADGKFKESLEAYQKAVKLDPENPYYHYNAGIIEGELGDFGAAFKSFREAVRLKPDHVQSHFRLGLFYAATGFPQEAVESFRQVIRYGTTEPEVAEAKRRIQQTLADADTKEKAVAYLLVGNAAAAMGESEKAIFAFRRAHQLNPKHTGIQRRLTEILMQSGDDQAALKAAAEGVSLSPEDAQLQFYLGQIEDKLNHPEKALKALREALRLSPGNIQMVTVLAKTLEKNGQPDEALSLLQDFVSQHPDARQVVLVLGRTLQKARRPAEAAALYDWYLSSHAETTEMLVERGLAAAAIGTTGVQPAETTGTAISGIVTGAGGVVGTPKYHTPTEWFERAIAIAGPTDARFVQLARAQIAGSRRLRMNIAQTVFDYNSNGNNSSTSPKTGISSKLTLSGTYIAYRAARVYVPISFTTAHDLHYTFQTYVNTNTLRVQFPTNLSFAQVTPLVSANFVRTQRGRSSKNNVLGGTFRGQLPYPRTLTVDYKRTDFTSYTNIGNNYLEERLDAHLGHNVSVGKGISLVGDIQYLHRVLDAVALSLDTDRTDKTLTLGALRTLANQRAVAVNAFYTDSEDVRPSNIRPDSATGEVVPILSSSVGANASYTFRVYPTVTGVVSGAYSVTDFTQGLFQTFSDPVSGDPITVETAQKQTSLSFGVTFTYRPDASTTWVVDIRQVEARASQDIPANVEDILTNQVIQDNINKRKTFTVTMNYAF